jgi:Sigma-70 region 2
MDRTLVERAQRGDEAAFEDLVREASDALFGVARRILGDPGLAEDALQNALLIIWRSSPVAIAGPGANIDTATWSASGSWIAFDRPITGTTIHDLYVIHPDGSGGINLTARFEPSVCCARWSPDSTALLASGTATTGDQSELLIVPLNGDPIAQVTSTPAQYLDFSWGRASR